MGKNTGTSPIAWGIPESLNKRDYGNTTNWTLARWRWEFVRRHEDYRTIVINLLGLGEQVEALRIKYRNSLTTEDKKTFLELNEEMHNCWNAYHQRWGYSSVLDPRVSEYPEDDLLVSVNAGGGVSYMIGSVKERIRYRNTIEPKHNEMVVLLNLDDPLSEQLKLAAEAAKRCQIERHGAIIGQRNRFEKWLDYLIVLDKKEFEGASHSKIGKLRPHTAQTPKTGYDTLKQAIEVQNRFIRNNSQK